MVRIRWGGWTCLVAWTVATLALASDDDPRSSWPTGRPVPVKVVGGRAMVTVPTSGPTLVVVSVLAQRPGSFAVSLAARRAIPDATARPLAREGRDSRSRLGRDPAHITENGAYAGGGGEPGQPESAGSRPSRRRDVAARGEAPGLPPPFRRRFWVLANDDDPHRTSSYLPVQGRLRAVGESVAVYVDDRDAEAVGDATVAEIVATLDESVVPHAARLWGQARDVDGDGRLVVLVTGWLARLGLDGCVRGADFDPAVRAPFGNGCDMIYLAAGLRPGPHLRTVLAHEYAHACTALRDEESWLDEAMAHLVEDCHGFSRSNLDHRVAEYLAAPERYSLVVADDRGAERFRSHGSRGSRYLFLRWCADRFGTERLLRALSVGDATGIANLEAATGESFAELYRSWSVALALDPSAIAGGGASQTPSLTRIEPDGPGEAWEAVGTSSHYVVVGASSTGAVEIEAVAPGDAGLQVTIVPLESGPSNRADASGGTVGGGRNLVIA